MVKYISVIFMEQTTQHDCIKRIRKAIETGSIEQIKELLPITDMTNDNGVSIILASQKGHVEIVKLLLTVCDASSKNSYALRASVYSNHLEIIKLLIPVSDPKANDSEALTAAVDIGNLEMVKLLIPVSDPKANNSAALQTAVNNNHKEIIELLIPVSDYNTVSQTVKDQSNGFSSEPCYGVGSLKQRIEQHEIRQQHKRLTETVEPILTQKTVSDKRKM